MSYRIGASPSQVDAQQKADAAKVTLLAQFDRFSSIMFQGASDIEADQPVLARALRDAVPRLRRGVDNVLAGTTSPDAWGRSVNALIAQVREEAPRISYTTLRSVGDSTVNAAKIAAQAAADLAVAAAATGGKAVKAAAEGAGLDLQKNIDTAASTTKWLAAAAIFGAIGYVAFLASPAIKAATSRSKK